MRKCDACKKPYHPPTICGPCMLRAREAAAAYEGTAARELLRWIKERLAPEYDTFDSEATDIIDRIDIFFANAKRG